jgi:hypothetical protein
MFSNQLPPSFHPSTLYTYQLAKVLKQLMIISDQMIMGHSQKFVVDII